MKYDIFISYRRNGSEDKARLINKKLKEMGYRVFFDHDTILRGNFETVIRTAIENSKIFFLLLSTECFTRCVDNEDFIRKEIEYAIINGIKIVLICPQGDIGKYEDLFNVDKLPKYIKELKAQECATIDFHENFETTCEYQVRKILPSDVYPTNITDKTEKYGADIHVITDVPCTIYSYGKQIGLAVNNTGKYGNLIRLRKGRHKLRFESLEDEDVFLETDYIVPDNEYVDYIEIKLEEIRREILKKKTEERIKYEQYILNKRRNLKQTRNYLLIYCSSTERYARGVSQVLQQIGNKCIMKKTHGQSMNGKKQNYSFDCSLYGEVIVLLFLSIDMEQDEASSIIEDRYGNIISLIFQDTRPLPLFASQKTIYVKESNDYTNDIITIIEQISVIKKETEVLAKKHYNLKIHCPNAPVFYMNYIEGGKYRMGNDNFNIEINVKDFYLCTTTVTNIIWNAIMNETCAWDRKYYPITNKPISKIQEFINRLNDVTDLEFYIPSEEEWEYAAREGKKSHDFIYSGSNALSEVAWYKDNSTHNHNPRNADAQDSSKHPNSLGLLFMSGNVWEICHEYKADNQGYVLRGGSFASPEEDCKVYSRVKIDMANGHKQVGLRLACRLKKDNTEDNDCVTFTIDS